MNLEELVVFLVIGGVAGWVGGVVIKIVKTGISFNIITGIIGAILCSFIFRVLGISNIGPLLTATAGAIFLLLVISLIRNR